MWTEWIYAPDFRKFLNSWKVLFLEICPITSSLAKEQFFCKGQHIPEDDPNREDKLTAIQADTTQASSGNE